MVADVVGTVYCEHYDVIHTKRENAPDWEIPARREEHCSAKAQAILRYTSYRGKGSFRVISFVTFVSQGWIAYVDGENTAHVYCPLHNDIKYSSGRSHHVEG